MENIAEENVLLEDPFLNMKVTELRKELKARGLPATGTKVELLERLQSTLAADKSDVLEPANDSLEAPDLSLDLATEDDAESEAVDIEKAVTQTIETKPLKKRAVHESSNGAVPTEQKITLNRTSSISVTAPKESVTEDDKILADDADAKVVAAPAVKAANTVKTMTANERLAMRAQRFNVASTENKTLKLSSGSTTTTAVKSPPKSVMGGTVKAPDIDVLKKRAERFGENVSTVLKQLEEKERVLKRKLRFGASASSSALSSVDSQEKKKIRAQRFGLS